MFFFFFSQTEEWKQFSAKVTDQLKYKANRNLYHYTSPEGLIGILGNNKLWFTESGCLNDESEGKYIYSLIQNCIETNLTFNIDFSEEVRKQIIENRTIINDSKNNVANEEVTKMHEDEKSKYFICSFSLDKDALPLWNYYTKTPTSIGYNISFSSSKLNKSVERGLNGGFNNRYFYKVIYDEKVQNSIIMEALEIGNRLWTKHEDDLYRGDLIFWLKEFFELIKFGFKHPAFESEKEVIMILRMSSSKFEELIVYNSNLSYNEIKIRTIKGVFVPYVEMRYDKSAMNGIMVSPTVKDVMPVESLNLLLKKYSYTDCNIEKSDRKSVV